MKYLFPSDLCSRSKISYQESLDTVKVIKMLYGRDPAEKFFTDNISVFYNIDNASFSND